MNASDIECFLKVAELMSFSKAAEALYISQQAVSLHIKHLESTYDVLLFERKPSLKLTDEGRILLESAVDILEKEENLRDRLVSKKETFTGEIAIGLPPNRSSAFVNDFIPRFSKRFPNMTVRLMEAPPTQLPIAVKDNQIDLALTLLTASSEQPEESLFNQELLEDEDLYVIISKELFRKSFGENSRALAHTFVKGVSLFQFADFPMFVHPESSGLHRRIVMTYKENGYNPFIRVKTTRTSSLVKLCAEGHGIFFSNPMLLKYIYSMEPGWFRDLYLFPLTEFKKTRQSILFYHKKKYLSLPLIESIDIIKSIYLSHTSIMDTLLPGQFHDE